MCSHWLLALYFEHTIPDPEIPMQVCDYDSPSFRGCPTSRLLTFVGKIQPALRACDGSLML